MPNIDSTIVFTGDLLPLGFPRFVVNKDVGLTIEIDVLFNLFNLSLLVIVGPAIHFAVTVGISFLADDIAPLIVKETGHGLLACCWIGGQE